MTRKQVLSGAEAKKRYPRLAAWWDAAKAHGTIYSRTDVSRSGMSATVLLWTLAPHDDWLEGGRNNSRHLRFDVAWPDTNIEGEAWTGITSEECAKRVGFSFKRRAFVVGGCGFNRALEVADRVANLFGDDKLHGETWQKMIRLETINQPE